MTESTSNNSNSTLASEFARLTTDEHAEVDVFSFLEQHPNATLNEVAEVCIVDQNNRWNSGLRPVVEEYLERIPRFGDSATHSLQLVFAEYRLRSQHGAAPQLGEFVQRFPQFRLELLSEFSGDDPASPTASILLPEAADEDLSADCSRRQPPSESSIPVSSTPTMIDRYRVQRILGDGGFGRVYLATDEELRRSVALKVPHEFRVSSHDDVETYLEEARILASLDHPAIVPVYDSGRSDEHRCFTVTKYVEGSDLAVKNRRTHLSFTAAAELISKLADALQYSHEQGVFHRDIKPANILIDLHDRPYISDFGIALKEEDWGKEQATAGTPAYMSPEQIRGEGHLVDGRSDIFSLGVVLYELLSGQRPFAKTVKERLVQTEARPLRQIDDSIPIELDRICARAMAHRVTERYNVAQEMADDLRHFIQHATTSGPATHQHIQLSSDGIRPTSGVLSSPDALTIVPKGLRSFGRADAAFFPELLEGPRDRHGIPESVRFWKERVADQDPQTAFRVGLLYGPSGCGKSSFLKAAVLPQLPTSVIRVYVESTPHETELRLLGALRQHCPHIRRDLGLAETMATLRRERILPVGSKLLIVLDQFEQWLHARHQRESDELIRALRQCDGIHLQCLIAARDDFWMAITHLMEDLEVSLVPDHNVAVIDLFSQRHARKVLTAMGRAYGALPAGQTKLDRPQRQFVHRAVDELSAHGQVIPVQLSLFAEMVSSKPWVSATLQELGGAEGVGVTFLEETFNGRGANPNHRLHQKGARAVLATLLEEHDAGIKGGMRSHREMRRESGYEHRPHDFDALLRILDSELRLITPTDPEGLSTVELESAAPAEDERYYHLTHDYLVPSLTEWLSRKKKETLRGRTELLLEERTRSWQARPSTRTLPSFAEWLRIQLLMPRRNRAHLQAEQQMMRKATGHYLKLTTMVVAIVIALSWWAWDFTHRSRAQTLVETLAAATPTDVPTIIEEINPVRDWADTILIEELQYIQPDSRAGLNLTLARLPVDAGVSGFLTEQLLEQDPETLNVITQALLEHGDASELAGRLWVVLSNDTEESSRRLRAAAALAQFQDSISDADSQWPPVAEFLSEELVRAIADNRSDSSLWTDDFLPIRRHLTGPLTQIYSDTERTDTDRDIAAGLLADYVADQPDQLVELLIIATPQQHRILMPRAEELAAAINSFARTIYETPPADNLVYEARSAVLQRQAFAAALLFALGDPHAVWAALEQSTVPGLQSFTEHRLSELALDAQQLLNKLNSTSSPAQKAAILRTLGAFTDENQRSIPEPQRSHFLETFEGLLKNHADRGIHGAADYALRSWGHEINLDPQANDGKEWYVNSQGQTMVIISGPVEYTMGSPDGEPGRGSYDESQHDVFIDRSFSISSTEISRTGYLKHNPNWRFKNDVRAPYKTCPAGAINWVEAVKYCQWLCEQENIPLHEWCYPKDIPVEFGMELPENFIDRSGYRLPTDAEWEYACRCETSTVYAFGDSEDLLADYAWYLDNSNGTLHPIGVLKPNRWGLFDMHGNVSEGCHDLWKISRSIDIGERRPLRIGAVNGEEAQTAARGGGFSGMAHEVRAANRRGNFPTKVMASVVGFRIARTVP